MGPSRKESSGLPRFWLIEWDVRFEGGVWRRVFGRVAQVGGVVMVGVVSWGVDSVMMELFKWMI